MKIVDISYPIVADMPVYPGDNSVFLQKSKTLELDHYTAFYLKTGLHAGTHIDIPMHLLDDNTTVDLWDIDHFIGNGVLLDVRGEHNIKYHAEYTELITDGAIVLLWTDYCDLFTSPDKYYNNHPIVCEDLADFFVSKQIKMLGIDMPSPDKAPFSVHKKLLNNSIIILENVTNLEALSKVKQFTVHAVPLKIQAEASLVRAFCIAN